MNWYGLLEESKLSALLRGEYAKFAKPISEALAEFLGNLSPERQTEILAKQARLNASANLSQRLAELASCCSVLQKIGQILARDQRLSLELRLHLRELECLPASVSLSAIQQTLEDELGALESRGIQLKPPAIAEASVAVVIPFESYNQGKRQEGVFKILKPGIEEKLEEELSLLESVGRFLDDRCEALQIPRLNYQDTFKQVKEKLSEEIHLENEQRHLIQAREFYADDARIHIPEVYELCTPRVTAMERIYGTKVTEQVLSRLGQNRLSSLIVETLIAKPIFSMQDQALFHCDPHAGNLFWTTEGRLAILDWSLVSYLSKEDRIQMTQVILATLRHNENKLVDSIQSMASDKSTATQELKRIARESLKQLRWKQLPGLNWLVSLMDEAAKSAGLQFSTPQMLFRKSLFTLSGLVAEIEAVPNSIDRVLWVELIKNLIVEYPSRWFSLPNSHNFPTSISNFDLLKGILSVPQAVLNYSIALTNDLCDFSQNAWNTMPQGAYKI